MASSRLTSVSARLTTATVFALCITLSGCLDQQTGSLDSALHDWVRDGNYYPYNKDSPYRNVLNDCLQRRTYRTLCRVGVLPPMGYPDGRPPTVNEIMDRVLVTHDWMGRNFRKLLTRMPDDTRYLMRSVGTIVIGSNVRPAYYNSDYVMIAIDPNYLWLTEAQRNTINLEPDYRSEYDEDLLFDMPWRYTKNNQYAYDWVSVEESNVENRSVDEIFYAFARLLYHELAHAVDFLPPIRFSRIRADHYGWEATTRPRSDQLGYDGYSLESEDMFKLAEVAFTGYSASNEIMGRTPTEVAAAFSPDHATDWYNYHTSREDLAMMFEEVMMKHHFDIDRDVAVTSRADGESTTDELVVTWGQRNRMGTPRIRARFREVFAKLLPEFPTDEILDGLPEPTPLQAGESWHDNLDPENLSPDEAPTPARRDTRRPPIH